ncbi:unnamed protein product, partial [Musa acuminata var. zebrina]
RPTRTSPSILPGFSASARRPSITDKLLNRMFDVILMYVRVFWYVHALYNM